MPPMKISSSLVRIFLSSVFCALLVIYLFNPIQRSLKERNAMQSSGPPLERFVACNVPPFSLGRVDLLVLRSRCRQDRQPRVLQCRRARNRCLRRAQYAVVFGLLCIPVCLCPSPLTSPPPSVCYRHFLGSFRSLSCHVCVLLPPSGQSLFIPPYVSVLFFISHPSDSAARKQPQPLVGVRWSAPCREQRPSLPVRLASSPQISPHSKTNQSESCYLVQFFFRFDKCFGNIWHLLFAHIHSRFTPPPPLSLSNKPARPGPRSSLLPTTSVQSLISRVLLPRGARYVASAFFSSWPIEFYRIVCMVWPSSSARNSWSSTWAVWRKRNKPTRPSSICVVCGFPFEDCIFEVLNLAFVTV